MKIIASTGNDQIAKVYIMDLGEEKLVECVEAMQPPYPIDKKWILLVSTMYGCPIGCKMCDAGGFYKGKLSAAEIFEQLDYMVYKNFPDGVVTSRQFKIQFSRVGEPALNPAVLDVLETLPQRYQAPGLMPSISTIAPKGCDSFLEKLLLIKNKLYNQGNFQFQFSVHTTDETLRDEIIPVKKWSYAQMAAYGERFFQPGDRKITLNFALTKTTPVDAAYLRSFFDPEKFIIKITPLNPTYRANQNGLSTYIDPNDTEAAYPIIQDLKHAGYDLLLSIGETEENLIGSNCGQYIRTHLNEQNRLENGYTYDLAYDQNQ